MKKHHFRKSLSALLALSMMAATVAGSMSTVYAGGDSLPPREGEQGHKGDNQPTYWHYSVDNMLEWEPEKDQYSEFITAKVPLQERNKEFKATQANPMLDQEVQCTSLAGDYGNHFINPPLYNDEFALYLQNFWQYQDCYAEWHGVVVAPTPDGLVDVEAPWNERYYEFGTIGTPNPAYTNAAHKNGVKSLGGIFFPRTDHTDQILVKDENGEFPIVDKLVELAEYQGFDGYFINAEETLSAEFMPLYQEFCRALTSRGLYIQVYASNRYGQNNQSSWGTIDYYNKDATEFSNWIKDPEDATIAANSLYMNPDPSKSMVDGSVSAMESLGLDPRATVFNTLEAGQTGFSGTRGSLYNTLDENLVPRTGIAALGTDSCYSHLDEKLFGHSGNNSYQENRRGDPDYQKYIFARERSWWAGALDTPTYDAGQGTLGSAGLSREELLDEVLNATFDPVAVANNPDRGKPNEGQSYQTWRGMSAFISERSVVDGTNFYTNFNTGHGMQYFVDGKVSNDHEWANINIQDILPTWQWWIDTESENRLTLDFDYGEKYSAAYDYTQVGGYDGGSSLAIFGDVDAQSDIRLYKTDLDVTETTELNIVYNKPSATDDTTLSAVLYFQDGDAVHPVYMPIENANVKTDGWVSASLDLSDYAGDTIAAFGLSVDTNGAAVEDYQINIGEMTITDNKLSAPAAPTGLTIDKAFDTSELYISWDLADYSDVQKYNVYAEFEDGTEMYMGGTYDDVYYIKSLYEPKGNVTIKVTAEGADGKESEAATVTRNFDEISSDLTVEEGVGVLNASWTNPDMDYASIRADVTFPHSYYGHDETYSATFAKDAESGNVFVPIADGSNYTFRLSYLDEEGNVISSTDRSGQLPDLYCAPYDDIVWYSRVPGKGWKLDTPNTYDWWHLTAWYNGRVVKDHVIRGIDDLTGLPLQGDFGYVEVQLEDYAGNQSEITRAYYGAAEKAVDETIFPDPVLLEAVKTQVGETMDKVIAFDGTLDLSGLDIKNFTGLSYFEHLTGIDFTNSPVTAISGLDTLSNLKTVNITGCTNLQTLKITGTSAEELVYGDAAAFENLLFVDLSDNRFDFSEGTPERAFVDAIQEQINNYDGPAITEPVSGNVAINGSITADTVDDWNTNFVSPGNIIDGDRTSEASANNTIGAYMTVDLGKPMPINKWAAYLGGASGANCYPGGFTVLYSNDNVEFTELESITEKTASVERTLGQPVEARYWRIRLDARADWSAIVTEFELYADTEVEVTPSIEYGNQRPLMYPNVEETVTLEKKLNGEAFDLNAYYEQALQNAVTNRGTTAAELAEADFIAEGYNPSEALSTKELHQIKVTDANGNVTMDSVPTNVAGTYTVDYITFAENGLETVMYSQKVIVKAVTSVLEKVVAKAEQMKADGALDNTMEAVVTEFNAALQAAKDLLAKEDATQEELNAAAVRLIQVMNKVDWKQGDKTILEVAVDVANSINENLDLYVEAGKQEFIDALAKAEELLASGNAWQDDIDAATDALIEAMSNLRMAPNKDILNDMINQASGLDLSVYTADSAAALNEALANAKAVAADNNATQAQIDTATDTLKAAMSGLVFVNGDNNQAVEDNTTDTAANTPVGEGTAPTKTGDTGAAGLAALALMSAGALIVLKKKNHHS